MKRFLIVVMFCITPFCLLAQYKNNKWLLGYATDYPAPYNGSKLIFYQDSVAVSYDPRSMWIFGCYSGLSAQDDSWFVYTNGKAVCNKNQDTLYNGGGLSPGGDPGWDVSGYYWPTMAVIIPEQNTGNILYMLHQNSQGSTLPYYPYPINTNPRAMQIYYSKIDATLGNKGTVVSKNQLLHSDTAELGGLIPCRHANGRDWWLLIKKFYSNEYYTYLITPNGPELKFIQTVPGTRSILAGTQCFSPNGELYASFDNIGQLRLYDFDRCTGYLSNFRYKHITSNLASGISFSPNSNYLYVSSNDSLWQFDMQAPDFLNSQIFIDKYDGYVDSALGIANAFFIHWLAPDGKIYLSAFSGSRVLHVINNPDELGTTCNFEQHAVHFPTYNNGTTPTYVNLNLFQVPGSVCDTLEVGGNELIIANSSLKIRPNPSNGIFSIEYIPKRVNGMLYVYDIAGKEVYREYVSPFSSIKNLDLSNTLMRGIFAVKLVFGDSITMGKVIIY
jgi:hypothetical protein